MPAWAKVKDQKNDPLRSLEDANFLAISWLSRLSISDSQMLVVMASFSLSGEFLFLGGGGGLHGPHGSYAPDAIRSKHCVVISNIVILFTMRNCSMVDQ